jgi:hypothetical protein
MVTPAVGLLPLLQSSLRATALERRLARSASADRRGFHGVGDVVRAPRRRHGQSFAVDGEMLGRISSVA